MPVRVNIKFQKYMFKQNYAKVPLHYFLIHYTKAYEYTVLNIKKIFALN